MFDSNEISKQAKIRAADIITEKKRRKRRWEAAIFFGVCATVSVVILFFLIINPSKSGYISLDDSQIPLAVILDQTGNSVVPYAGGDNAVILPYVDIAAVSAITREARMVLFNPADNFYYFVFEIITKDVNETLYKTGFIAPGMCIENPALSKTLPSGEHSAVLRIWFYEFDDLTPKNSAEINFILSAE